MTFPKLKFVSLLVSALTLGFVLTAQAQVVPQPAFNFRPSDSDFLTAKDITTNSGFVDPLATHAGDTAEIAVYYHNGVIDSTAQNAVAKVVLPTDTSTSHLITGSIKADNAPEVTGTIVGGSEIGKKDLTITSDVNTTLQFISGSVKLLRCNNSAATSSSDCGLVQINFPTGVNPDTIVTSGVNFGNIQGCFQFSGFITFEVKLNSTIVSTPTPSPTPQQATLQLKKLVRRAGTNETFSTSTTANPGQQLEYDITVRNIDNASTANNITLLDTLPADETLSGTVMATISVNGVLIPGAILNVSSDLFTKGTVITSSLGPNQVLELKFLANTSSTIPNNDCRINTVTLTTSNASVTASACFMTIISTPTPKPSPTLTPTPSPTATSTTIPTPTPTPVPLTTLPQTGPEMALAIPGGLGGLSFMLGTVKRRSDLKRKIRDINVL